MLMKLWKGKLHTQKINNNTSKNKQRFNHVTYFPGSIPEEDDGKLFNTCTVFGPDGQLILKHRKVIMRCLVF